MVKGVGIGLGGIYLGVGGEMLIRFCVVVVSGGYVGGGGIYL